MCDHFLIFKSLFGERGLVLQIVTSLFITVYLLMVSLTAGRPTRGTTCYIYLIRMSFMVTYCKSIYTCTFINFCIENTVQFYISAPFHFAEISSH